MFLSSSKVVSTLSLPDELLRRGLSEIRRNGPAIPVIQFLGARGNCSQRASAALPAPGPEPHAGLPEDCGRGIASFSLNAINKAKLVQEGALAQILVCIRYKDLEVQQDCAFALANIADSVEYQNDVVREGGLEVLATVASCPDARVQREIAQGPSQRSLFQRIFISQSLTRVAWMLCSLSPDRWTSHASDMPH